ARPPPTPPPLPCTTLFRSRRRPRALLAGAHGGRVSRPLSRGHPAQQDGARGRGAGAVTDVLDIIDIHDGGRLSQLAPEWWELWRSEEHTSELQSRENLVCR